MKKSSNAATELNGLEDFFIIICSTAAFSKHLPSSEYLADIQDFLIWILVHDPLPSIFHKLQTTHFYELLPQILLWLYRLRIAFPPRSDSTSLASSKGTDVSLLRISSNFFSRVSFTLLSSSFSFSSYSVFLHMISNSISVSLFPSCKKEQINNVSNSTK